MLNYKKCGNGPEVLVLLHGLMESGEIWTEMESFLTPHFTLIIPDLPGHGKSADFPEINTMEKQADAVLELLTHLEISKCHIAGHSMGGYTGLAIAEKKPDLLKSITLFFSNFLADDEEKKSQRKKSFRLITEAFSNYVSAGIPPLFAGNRRDLLQPQIEFTKEIALQMNPEAALASVKGIMERKDRTFVLKDDSIRFLLLSGNQDEAVDTFEMLKKLPEKHDHIRYYVLDCGHNGHLECPSLCSEILLRELTIL